MPTPKPNRYLTPTFHTHIIRVKRPDKFLIPAFECDSRWLAQLVAQTVSRLTGKQVNFEEFRIKDQTNESANNEAAADAPTAQTAGEGV